MTTPQAHELPELPVCWTYEHPVRLYTADQMREYGQSCIESALQSASAEGDAVAWNERALPSLRNRLMMRFRVHGMGETEAAKVANEEVDFVETVLSAYFGKWLANPEAQSGDWVMVPREPTTEMQVAGWSAHWHDTNSRDVWAAMLSAAPQPPVGGSGGAEAAGYRYRVCPLRLRHLPWTTPAIAIVTEWHTPIPPSNDIIEYQPVYLSPQPPAASVEDVEAQARELLAAHLDRDAPTWAQSLREGKDFSKFPMTSAALRAITAALRTRSVGELPEPPGGIEFGDWAAWLRDRITSMLDPYVQGPHGNQLADWLDSLEQRAASARTVSRGDA